MRRCLPCQSRARRQRGVCTLVLLVGLALGAPRYGSLSLVVAQQDVDDYAPASGHAQVIAQGVVELPEGAAQWRVTRPLAPLPADAEFAERPLGFVVATDGPLLLVDEDGSQTRLGKGEAALVQAGAFQQRSSLGPRRHRYFSIELLPTNAPPPPPDAIEPGINFAAPPGLHDLDLLSDTLHGAETLQIPESGSRNLLVVIRGQVAVSRGEQDIPILPGKVQLISDPVTVSVVSPSGAPQPDPDDFAVFVVAMIGPELQPAEGQPR